ncbi:hypothetical protein [Nonomuraea dietziae]|uniref:hypothetical protein n=1 Tax=Nonomuraea dietziae TaxID=65515 RepID=UPI00344989DE
MNPDRGEFDRGERLHPSRHVRGPATSPRHPQGRGHPHGCVSQPLPGVMMWSEAPLVLSFLRYWRLPQVQRDLVAGSFFISLSSTVSGAL